MWSMAEFGSQNADTQVPLKQKHGSPLGPGYEVYNTPDLSEIVVGRTDPSIQ